MIFLVLSGYCIPVTILNPVHLTHNYIHYLICYIAFATKELYANRGMFV